MSKSPSICAILNPTAGNGHAGRERSNIEIELAKHFETWVVWETQHPRHAIDLAKQAGEEDYDIVVAVGGDGSIHEVTNGIMRLPKEKRPTLGVIPFGTGGDFRKSLEIPKNIAKAVHILSSGTNKIIDIGFAKVTNKNGNPEEKHFINVAGFGANGEVVDKSNRWSKRFGGRVTFLNATLHTTFTYHAPKVRLKWKTNSKDSDGTWTGELLSCFIANAAFCGGGMQVAPNTALGDGQIHLRVLPKMSVSTQLFHLPKLYSNEIHKIPDSVVESIVSVEAAPNRGEVVQIDLDGELSGMLPAQFSLIENALEVRGGWA